MVGCPRSGTSWLQVLLSQHPKVATTPETHLFSAYLKHLGEAWERHKSLKRRIGMIELLSDDDFYQMCGAFAGRVFQKIAETNPGAEVVLEKTPDHVHYAPLILRLLPEAWFLHIIRDPRSVVSSLVAAAQSWGAGWWSSSIVDNALQWSSDVKLGRQIATLTPRYYEVRYEDLLGDAGPKTLQGIFAWLELPADLAFCQSALKACSIDQMRQEGKDIRDYKTLKSYQPGFVRKGQPDAWKQELSQTQIAIIEYLVGDLMRECGYLPSTVGTGSAAKLRVATYSALEFVEKRLRWRMDSAFRKARSVL